MSGMSGERRARESLNAIGTRHGTDKGKGGHGYLDFYERFLAELRDRPITLLEIGVLGGRSARTWAEYFPAGRIIGVDIDRNTLQFAGDRIIIEMADQSDVRELVRLGVTYGPFDVVVDDGSHLWNHQIATLQYLYPFVRPGGYFIMEDIHTSFGDYRRDYRGNATCSAFDYLTKLNALMVGDIDHDLVHEEDSFLRSYAPMTEFVALHRHTAVLRTRQRRLPRADVTHLLAEGGAEQEMAMTLGVHIAFLGDATSEGTLSGGLRGSQHPIQGFVVTMAEATTELEYRALLPDGRWTTWMPAGSFLGSRGQGVSLYGFAARLRGRLVERFTCLYAGSFVQVHDVVVAEDGADCRGPDGAALEAMQIVLRPR